MGRRTVLGIVVAVAACGPQAAPSAPMAAIPTPSPKLPLPRTFPRVPHDFVPVGYRADLDIRDHDLSGTIAITGDVTTATALVYLDATDLRVHRARARRDAEDVELTTSPLGPQYEDDTAMLALQAAHPLAPGRWVITLDYDADIGDQDADYVAPYPPMPGAPVDHGIGAFREDFEHRSYLFTQSEPTYARRIFPCVDEPSSKVPWQLALTVAAGDLAASNTPILSDTPLPGDRHRVQFAPTPPLPSYLVAFVVGPFDVVDAGASKAGVPIRILEPRGHAADAANPVAETSRIVDELVRWTDLPFPYAKLDLVSMPATGSWFSAMESAGLVTFQSQIATRREAWLDVASHELAHHWFGDLVTMAWWDDIWLNESFATWMSDKIVTEIEPRFGTAEYQLNARQWAMYPQITGPVAVRPSRDTANRPEELRPYFHGGRGAQVLDMVEAYAGREPFQRGVRAYLRAHANGTAVTADLVSALDASTGKALDPIFAHYLDDPAIPTLTAVARCARAGSTIELSTDETSWTIPACVAYDRDGARAESCTVVTGGHASLPIATARCPAWIMPDVDGAGLYNTSWSAPAIAALVQHGWTQLSRTEQLAVISELPGRAAANIALVPLLIAHGDDVAMDAVVTILTAAYDLVPDDLHAALDAVIEAQFAAAARAVHFRTRAGDPTAAHQVAVVELVARTGDRELAHEAAFLIDHPSFPPEFTAAVWVTAANADPRIADRLVDEVAVDTMNLRALVQVHDGLALLARNVDRFRLAAPWIKQQLRGVCNPTDRATAAAIQHDLDDGATAELLTQIDDCIASRAAVEPAFRAWLKPAKSAKP